MKLLVVGDLHGKIDKLKKNLQGKEFDFIIGVGDYAGIDDWYPYIKYIFKIKDRKKAMSPQEFFGKKEFKDLLRRDFAAGKKALRFLDSLGKSGFFIFGNGDDEWYDYPFMKGILTARKSLVKFWKDLRNLKEMTYKVRRHKGISFLGFGGYMDVRANYERWEDEVIKKRVEKRLKRSENKMHSLSKKIGKKSVFIFHYPPKGVFDIIKEKGNPFKGKSAGIDFYRDAILKEKPFLVLCGHMHEYQGKKSLGRSLVVNPGEASKGEFAIVDIDEKKGKVKKIQFIN